MHEDTVAHSIKYDPEAELAFRRTQIRDLIRSQIISEQATDVAGMDQFIDWNMKISEIREYNIGNIEHNVEEQLADMEYNVEVDQDAYRDQLIREQAYSRSDQHELNSRFSDYTN